LGQTDATIPLLECISRFIQIPFDIVKDKIRMSPVALPIVASQSEEQVLPDSTSPDLHLSHPTDEDNLHIWQLTPNEWKNALTIPKYLEEFCVSHDSSSGSQQGHDTVDSGGSQPCAKSTTDTPILSDVPQAVTDQ
jgi:hypothetical protein